MQLATRLFTAIALTCGLACSPPPVTPPDEKPPEPQATALRDAVHAPIDKAKAVGDTVEAAADRRRDAVDAPALPQ